MSLFVLEYKILRLLIRQFSPCNTLMVIVSILYIILMFVLFMFRMVSLQFNKAINLVLYELFFSTMYPCGLTHPPDCKCGAPEQFLVFLFFIFFICFISIFILRTRRKATEALIHRVGN